MKHIMTAVLTVAAMSVATTQAGAQDTGATMHEMQMVEDTLKRLLVELKIPSETADRLTIDQARQIIQIADSREMGGARAQVLEIIGE